MKQLEKIFFLLALIGFCARRVMISTISVHLVGFALLILFYAVCFYFLMDRRPANPWQRICIVITGIILALSVAAIFSQDLDYSSWAYEAPGMLIILLITILLERFLMEKDLRRQINYRLIPAAAILLIQILTVAFSLK